MSLFGFLESAAAAVISPVVDIVEGDITLTHTRENVSDALGEVGDTLTGKITPKSRK